MLNSDLKSMNLINGWIRVVNYIASHLFAENNKCTAWRSISIPFCKYEFIIIPDEVVLSVWWINWLFTLNETWKLFIDWRGWMMTGLFLVQSIDQTFTLYEMSDNLLMRFISLCLQVLTFLICLLLQPRWTSQSLDLLADF